MREPIPGISQDARKEARKRISHNPVLKTLGASIRLEVEHAVNGLTIDQVYEDAPDLSDFADRRPAATDDLAAWRAFDDYVKATLNRDTMREWADKLVIQASHTIGIDATKPGGRYGRTA
jgi:hypothetical protein